MRSTGGNQPTPGTRRRGGRRLRPAALPVAVLLPLLTPLLALPAAAQIEIIPAPQPIDQPTGQPGRRPSGPRGVRPPAERATPIPEPLVEEDAYILGPGDGLNLRFLAVTEFSGPVDILNDGTTSLPLVGNVRLAGLTVSQATLWLESLYRGQLQRPNLQLTVVRPRPLRVGLVGEVTRPGLYTLNTGGDVTRTEGATGFTGLPTLVDAIQKAGGVTTTANLRSVWVQRRLPGNEPRFKRARVDLLALVREGDQTQNPLLFDGDTIRIDRVEESAELSAEMASSTLSPTAITVTMVGEVKSPGRLQVPANTPLMQAILVAGGPDTWRANTRKVEVVRIFRNGSAQRRTYRYDPSQSVSIANNPPLVDGDTVIVNRSRYAVSADAIGAVSQPLSGLVNVLTLFRLLDNNL
jgi:polysaccharide export outer membrane protein